MAAPGEIDREVIVHKRGYDGFVGLMKWGAIASFVIAMIVVFLIAE
jgi:hypothetical protein